MADNSTLNPYSAIGSLLGPGLDAIVAAAPHNVDTLIAQVETYIETTFYPSASAQVQIEISSIAYNAVNSYRNNLVLSGLATYNGTQAPFIEMLIGQSMTANVQPDTFEDRVADIEDNIGTSDLTVNDQTPLFLATTLGTNAADYWAAQLGGGGSWASYLSGNDWEDYINSLLWDVAAMNGALAAYGATPAGLIEPTTNMVSTNMISALIGALTVTAGKVMFNWIPRITKPLQLGIEKITNLNNNHDNGGEISADCIKINYYACKAGMTIHKKADSYYCTYQNCMGRTKVSWGLEDANTVCFA